MKIGILLVGISYGTGPYGSNKDFRSTVENFKETVIEPLSKNHEVQIYVCTYKNDLTDQLKEAYNPKVTEFIDFAGSSQISTYVKGLNLLQNEDLDFIISTRFDIEFMQKITEINIDYDKVNFLFGLDVPEAPWHSWEFVTDNIFMFNAKYLSKMLEAIDLVVKYPPRQESDLHGIYKKLKTIIPQDQIKICIDEKSNYSNRGKYYKLKRS